MMRRLLRYVALPRTITPFEQQYLVRLNRLAFGVLLAHLPVLVFIAWWNDTGPGLAAALGAVAIAGPVLAMAFDDRLRRVSTVIAISAVLLAGILVHVGQGPMQIEMHFHFFVIVASLAVFGNPQVVLAATGTVALHHLAVWLIFPVSVFNYDAAVWVVAVHTLFLALETVGACFIARGFFDNVIGFERIVEQRTRALAARQRDMRQLLDNVAQGFLTIDPDGQASPERSRAVDRWFGEAAGASSWFDLLESLDPAFGSRSRSAWAAVAEDFLPIELNLAQMPRLLQTGSRSFEIEYRPIASEEGAPRFLVVISDVSERVRREAADAMRREDLELLAGLLDDRAGTLAFLDDASRSLAELASTAASLESQQRSLHTLKGNAGVAGFGEIATRVHRLEDRLGEGTGPLGPVDLAPLGLILGRFAALADQLREGSRTAVEVEPRRLDELETAILDGEGRSQLIERARDLRRDPVEARLARLGEHAQRLADRLGRSNLSVRTEGAGVRVDRQRWAPIWANLVHTVNNAVGHGLETREERLARGKHPEGHLSLRASESQDHVVIEVEDDGRGIDLDRVAARARALGVRADTESEILDAVFADGLSTAAQVDEVAGRGVGMAALKAAVTELGGHVQLFTRSGHGTRIRIEVPRRAEDTRAGKARRRSSAASLAVVPPAATL